MSENERMPIDEALFEKWYDSRKGMPPAAYESWKAGWDAAIKSLLAQ